MPKLGPMELGLILLIIIIVFGVGKLPQIGSAFGKTIREFKQATKSDEATDEPKKVAAVKPAAKPPEE